MQITIQDTTYQTCPHVGCNNLHPVTGDTIHINHSDIQHDPDPEVDHDEEEEEEDDEEDIDDEDHQDDDPHLNE